VLFISKIKQKIFSHVIAFARGEKRITPCWLLIPFAYFFSVGIAMRNFLFDHGAAKSIEPEIPVISVGNISIGGTNKTPFVEMLCRILSQSLKVGIISRGYGGKNNPSPVIIIDGKGERPIVGDEPLLLSSRLPDIPIAVSHDRLSNVKSLLSLGVEIIVADDAFQHRRLDRDADIVLIDAICPFGNGTLLPSGILREPISSLKRAHIVVITKSDQVTKEELENLRGKLAAFVSSENIFTSRIKTDRWVQWDGAAFTEVDHPKTKNIKLLPFSAIGNPESFHRSLDSEDVYTLKDKAQIFRDHHLYSKSEMNSIVKIAKNNEAELVCTEKDIYNLPHKWVPPIPLWVPLVLTEINEPHRFYSKLLSYLKPHIVIASNGYGEDAVGVLLAERIQEKYPESDISIFPLVGKGQAYVQAGFNIYPEPSITPSGGILKYHILDLWRDIRSGLFKHIYSQIKSWGSLRGKIRTPLCVGDVYLLINTILGQGKIPLFMATAKTVYLSGHWRIERFILRHRSRMTWTRDVKTAEELTKSEVNARFDGNPIMDLSIGAKNNKNIGTVEENINGSNLITVVLLPGSRERAYNDVILLLEAVKILAREPEPVYRFIMIIAPTLDETRIRSYISDDYPKIELSGMPIAQAAQMANIVLGLGGTANQVCAGYGVPIISIEEKGKFVQKKLLGDSELLVPPTPENLAEAVLTVLGDKELYQHMSETGRERMGGPGAIEAMAQYTETHLGWKLRCNVWHKLTCRYLEKALISEENPPSGI
jgi:tetraacyldisaccharide 4'-kinase